MKIYYLPSHEYIKVEDNIGLVGISEYAAKQLGTVTYVDMPEEGDDVEKEEVFGAVESRIRPFRSCIRRGSGSER